MPTTHWSIILSAADPTAAKAQQALESLCRAYWYPLYACLRRQGRTGPEAQDLTQGFFAHLLDRQRLGQVQPRSGTKFRSWLLDCLRHYVVSEWRRDAAEKRGGGESPISLDAELAENRYHREPVDPTDPEKLFERKWVFELLDRVLARLERRYVAKGKQALFDALIPFIRWGDAPASQREVAERLGIKPTHLAVEVARLRDRYQEALRAEISDTVATHEDVDEEWRYLASVLGH
jgi:RNA polymerase sigma-70 factor (ECF subfamily)